MGYGATTLAILSAEPTQTQALTLWGGDGGILEGGEVSSALGPPAKIGVGVSSSSEILGALLSVLSIWVVTGVLVYLAVERLISGNYEIEGETMLITAGCAVAVNIM